MQAFFVLGFLWNTLQFDFVQVLLLLFFLWDFLKILRIIFSSVCGFVFSLPVDIEFCTEIQVLEQGWWNGSFLSKGKYSSHRGRSNLIQAPISFRGGAAAGVLRFVSTLQGTYWLQESGLNSQWRAQWVMLKSLKEENRSMSGSSWHWWWSVAYLSIQIQFMVMDQDRPSFFFFAAGS